MKEQQRLQIPRERPMRRWRLRECSAQRAHGNSQPPAASPDTASVTSVEQPPPLCFHEAPARPARHDSATRAHIARTPSAHVHVAYRA